MVLLAFLTFLIISFFVGLHQGVENGREASAENYANSHGEYAEEYIQNRCTDLSSTDLAECIKHAVEASSESQRGEMDLVAQQTMANYTKWLLGVSLITVVISVIGILYIRDTLRETREAVRAAYAGVDVAREIGVKQVRATLSYKDHLIEERDGHSPDKLIYISLVFENYGQSPARDVLIDIVGPDELIFGKSDENGYLPPPEFRSFDERKVKGGTNRICGPGQPLRTHYIVLRKSEVISNLQANRFFYVAGWVRYKDDFWTKVEDYRFCQFCFILQAQNGTAALAAGVASKDTLILQEHGPHNHTG